MWGCRRHKAQVPPQQALQKPMFVSLLTLSGAMYFLQSLLQQNSLFRVE